MIILFLFYTRKEKDIKKYVKKNLILYGIWFLILLPFTVIERQIWFVDGMGREILRCI